MNSISALATQHLLLRMGPINRGLREFAKQQTEHANALDRPEIAHLCVTDRHVEQLLDKCDAIQFDVPNSCLLYTSDAADE